MPGSSHYQVFHDTTFKPSGAAQTMFTLAVHYGGHYMERSANSAISHGIEELFRERE